MLHFGLGCKTTQLLSSKQENSLVFASTATALASPLTGVEHRTPAVECMTSVQGKTKEKLEENTDEKFKRGQMKTRLGKMNFIFLK